MAKILIIDDSNLIVHVARNILTKSGHEVVSAQDGMAGLQTAKAELPDLILLDLIMPVMDGYKVCQELGKTPVTKGIPIIMLTSKAEPSDKVKGLEMGALDYVAKPFDEGELVARVNTQLRIKELYQTLQEKNRLLREMANRDGLTELYNHRYFQDNLSKDFLRAKRYHDFLSCALLDIDHFKKFNDIYGHQSGDKILSDLARLIEGSIRDSDMCARYGGEEFALVLYHTDEAAAFYLADRIRQSVEKHGFQVTGKILNVTVSIGIATYPNKKISSHAELIKCADQALYRAKGNGRNRVEAFVIPRVS